LDAFLLGLSIYVARTPLVRIPISLTADGLVRFGGIFSLFVLKAKSNPVSRTKHAFFLRYLGQFVFGYWFSKKLRDKARDYGCYRGLENWWQYGRIWLQYLLPNSSIGIAAPSQAHQPARPSLNISEIDRSEIERSENTLHI
jgi:hypothetical protein